ncbi:hypothetical protein DYH09_32795 [bacterium CPR1]|nr:hypothetical protein [bacterium CPR1]
MVWRATPSVSSLRCPRQARPGWSVFIKVKPRIIAMLTLTRQMPIIRRPCLPLIRVRAKASRMANRMSGVARAFSRRMTSVPTPIRTRR